VVTTHARKNVSSLPAGRLVRADIRELPYAAESFDFVYTMGTIEHIPDYATALAEVRRVLRPGGKAVVGVPYRWNPFLRPALVHVLSRWGLYPYAPEKSFTGRELRRDLETAGLTVVDRGGILTIPGILRMADLFCFTRNIPLYKLSTWAVRPFQAMETRWSWPGRLGYLVAMAAEKP